jgi:hypothetical protein
MPMQRVKSGTANKKTARKAVSVFRLRLVQAARGALFRRRYVIAPMPAKPRIIIAQVEGSGTPVTTAIIRHYPHLG